MAFKKTICEDIWLVFMTINAQVRLMLLSYIPPPQVRNVLPPNFGVGAAAPSEYRDRRPCIQPPQRSTPQACMNFLEFNVHFRLEIKWTRKTGVSLPEVGRLSTGRLSSAQWRQTDSQIGYSIT